MTSPERPLVMSVEDNRDTQQLIERLLEKAGYDVVVAENGARALEMLNQPGSKPDLILLDIMMPEMNGYEFCASLQQIEELSYIPVIFLTALGEEQDKAKAFAVGAVDYVTKPIFKNKLLECVDKQLQTKTKWRQLQEQTKKITFVDYVNFKQYLFEEVSAPFEKREKLGNLPASQIYTACTDLGIPPARMAQTMAVYLKVPYQEKVDLSDVQLGILPAPFCRVNNVVAIKNASGQTVFVLSNPFNLELLDHLSNFTGQQSLGRLIMTQPDNIAALFKAGGAPQPAQAATTSAAGAAGSTTLADVQEQFRRRFEVEQPPVAAAESSEQSEPIIRLVNQFIENAYNMGASDIHIEPWENEVVVRYRVDGDMRVVNRFGPQKLILPIVARLKIMSNLDIAERRLPQDGRIVFKKYTRSNIDIDLRVATSPMNFGEKVVMRILDKNRSTLPLASLGFSKRNLDLYKEKIRTPYGMILHVGPTGSGKSMTLDAALNEIQRPELNVQTAEDPIEYTLPGINQMQVHREIGLTFQRALRSYLRMDPDVLLVGEIRDLETAEIAVEAALTGHLLLTTLHTNDSTSAITRLIEMGIEPYLVSSSIVTIVAQRLLRRLCDECKEPFKPNAQEKLLVGFPADGNFPLFRPKGCNACGGVGYKGRIGTHEIFVPDDEMKMMISKKGVSSESLKQMAVERCAMTTLYWDAMEKVRQGIDSLDDVLTKIRRDDFDSRPAWMFEELGMERPAVPPDRDSMPLV